MSIVFPENRKEVSDRISTDVQNELPVLTPQLRNSIIRSLIIGIAGRDFDIYTQLEQLLADLFPVTARDLEFIRRWGLFKGIDVNPASKALGFITVTGTAGTLIPDETLFNIEAGNQYEAINQDYTITANNLIIPSLTRSGNIATAALTVAHGLGSGTTVTITGADQSEYNGIFVVTVSSETSFTYVVSGTPVTPATGSLIQVTLNSASVEIQSLEAGELQNISNGTKVTLDTPLGGVDDDAFVQFTNVSGGTDIETTEDYQNRVLDAYANPISNFSAADIERTAKTIPGVTRVFVFEAFPAPGEVEIYFTRDNDADIIPDPNEVTTVKNEIIKIKSAPTLDTDVHVLAPTPLPVPFLFTSLSPDSTALRAAILNSLEQMFVDVAQVSEDLAEDAYRCAIFNSADPNTGEKVQSFALTFPSGIISVVAAQLAVLGTVTFNL